jgi:glycosyltransferase involved in cell wall biosynthesis
VKVSLVTTWNEPCGIAEYALNFVKNIPLDVPVSIIPASVGWHNCCNTSIDQQADIVVFNYEPGILGWLTPAQVLHLRNIGKKTVLILHTSHEIDNSNNLTAAFNKVVVHEPTRDNFVYIPHGIPVFNGACRADGKEYFAGSCGFPFPWKGFPEVAEAVYPKNCLLIIPISRHARPEPIIEVCKTKNAACTYYTNYAPEERVMEMLTKCEIAIFAYWGGNLGISGAVRLALASGTPTIVTRTCRQFRDLLAYEDEIEFSESPHPVHLREAITRLEKSGKKPARILEDMSWKVIAKRYMQLFEEIMG